ncbi:Hsp70 family protein [Catenuloplanes japonicus]|uniref:Hsp70 family protein n=1 Tax=Catenuloplanes japonicus TaxID=33876 RepID=UPI00052643EA|nr:Hsp70 family protein [Catenuloplanes japonicus]
MRQDGPYGLGVDLGTSNTVAVLHTPDGRTRPLLFDGQPIMPSGVYLDAQGRLHVGRDAQRLAQADPARYEPNPKRRIDESTVLLGDREVPVVDLLAAVLGAVARAAVETVGFLPPAMLTHPAAWGPVRRNVLAEAVARAGWPPAGVPSGTRFTPEPVAAARYFAEVLSRPVPVGSSLAVFDFGGGTLDVAVVRNDGIGPAGRPSFSVVSSGGVADLGGLDLDAVLVDHVGRLITTSAAQSTPDGPTQRLDLAAAQAWQALMQPSTVTQWRNRRQFWDDVRGAKEMLSRAMVAPIAVPGVEHAVHLTREELEQLVTPLLRRGVHETAGVIRAAGVNPNQLAGLFLVGGSSRVPMIGRLLHSDLHIPPTVLEQPELPVAEGALAELLSTTLPASTAHPAAAPPVSGPPVSGPPVSAAPVSPGVTPMSGPPVSGPPVSGPPTYGPPVSGSPVYGAPAAAPRSRRPLLVAGLAGVVVLALMVTAGLVVYRQWTRDAPVTFQTMTEGTLLPAIGDKPDSYVSNFYTTTVGDRAYVAAQRSDKTLEITGVDLGTGKEAWRQVTGEKTSSSAWTGIYATDRYVIADGDTIGDDPRPLVVYNSAGKRLWDRKLKYGDQLAIFNDVLMLIEDDTRRLLGLRLTDGNEEWSYEVPKGESSGEAFRIVWMSSPGDLSGPAAAGGRPLGWNADAPQRFVLVSADQRARVINVGDGSIVSERPVPLESSDLGTSLGVQLVADAEHLYVGTTSNGYRIDAYDLDTSADPVVVHNGGPERKLQTLIPCGESRICLVDAGAANDSEEVAAIEIADGRGEPAWREPAPGVTAAINPGAIVATGRGLLVWRKGENDTYRTTLFDDGGKKVFDVDGVGARVNSRSFLLFGLVPSGSTAESVGLSGLVDTATDPQQIGTLVEARLGSCSWSQVAIVCGSGNNGFRIQRFAKG